MSAGRKELSPLVKGRNTWCEEDVEFFKEAEATRLAGYVVTSQLLFQQVPGDVEAGALPSELVNVPAQGGAWLVLVLLLHVVRVPVVPLPKWTPCQPCVGLQAVGRVSAGDGGLVFGTCQVGGRLACPGSCSPRWWWGPACPWQSPWHCALPTLGPY